jgi:hypothetical protein
MFLADTNEIQSKIGVDLGELRTWRHSYKTFYGCNLMIFVLS